MLSIVFLVALCTLAVSGSGPCAPNEDLIQMLNLIHTAPSYAHLSGENKALLPELVSAAQSCQLTSYIYSVGLHKVLDLLDSITPSEAHLLNQYMKSHLELEHKLSIMYPASTAKTTT